MTNAEPNVPRRITAGQVVVAAGILIALAAAIWLRFYRLRDHIGGYHAFNEGFYVRLALGTPKSSSMMRRKTAA